MARAWDGMRARRPRRTTRGRGTSPTSGCSLRARRSRPEIAPDLRRKPKLRTAAGADERSRPPPAAARRRTSRGRADRRRVQGSGAAPVEQRSRRLALRRRGAGAHEGVVSRGRSSTGTARTRRGCRRRWNSIATAARRCSRSAAGWEPISRSSRSTARASPIWICRRAISTLAKENFVAARPAGPLRPAGRRDARVRRQHVRPRLQQRRAAPHAEHAARGQRDSPGAEARRTSHRRCSTPRTRCTTGAT